MIFAHPGVSDDIRKYDITIGNKNENRSVPFEGYRPAEMAADVLADGMLLSCESGFRPIPSRSERL
jgi:hypothetical protein